ncbi:tRNA pseudouridine synthase family protein [Histomonas meleagridis]|uniref:tRNA pseudouridine synthase family protein n=1 Tax=Histomonas meleagridis TaxID=135588 RepID=UPI00355A1767|nr:tRNA pseudouridine synthase family protein [Histomonas meleagridis]KAH0805846.1 tRNA pseudouridine synthase family protein [Histomonas meleagridis]
MGIFFSKPQESTSEKKKEQNKPVLVPGQSHVPLVLCYSYIGTGYHGLQQNKGQKTIESDLFHALINSYLIRPGVIANLNKIKWNEASRTDAGVHCCAQVLSFNARFFVGLKTKDVPALINSNLPQGSTIVVWKAIDVGRHFQAQKFAEYRKYLYLMPLYALGDNPDFDFIKNQVLPEFIGEKNYHNYTRGVSPTNPSAMRTITHFSFSDPFDLEGEQYILWTIRGKSFMINQIRKMLATVLSCAFGLLSIEDLRKTFTATKWALPRLPGDGLMLDRVEYPGFKRNAAKTPEFANPNKDVEFEIVRPQIEKWKSDVLFPHIASIVKQEDTFRVWIRDVLLPYPPVPQDIMNQQNIEREQMEEK